MLRLLYWQVTHQAAEVHKHGFARGAQFGHAPGRPLPHWAALGVLATGAGVSRGRVMCGPMALASQAVKAINTDTMTTRVRPRSVRGLHHAAARHQQRQQGACAVDAALLAQHHTSHTTVANMEGHGAAEGVHPRTGRGSQPTTAGTQAASR